MQISHNTRPYRAGKLIAEGLIETAPILYLLDNRAQYLYGIKLAIEEELVSVGLLITDKEVK